MPIQRGAFVPNEKDTGGISVFRALFVTPEELDASGRDPGNYYIAKFKVSTLETLGLSVAADPQADQPSGHCLIPELSLEMYKDEKKRSKEIQLELMRIAEIVLQPK